MSETIIPMDKIESALACAEGMCSCYVHDGYKPTSAETVLSKALREERERVKELGAQVAVMREALETYLESRPLNHENNPKVRDLQIKAVDRARIVLSELKRKEKE